MSLSPEAQAALTKEESTLDGVLRSLREQIQRGIQRLNSESERSRALTSELVAARRVEDKAMLASDESVSHSLKDQKKGELESLRKVVAKPYFARLVVEEEFEGKPREFEYKIGFAANTDCRIIDWRKAPISKLYYEYRENDEYSEQIQGRERNGRVVLRNTIDIEREQLKKVTCRYGTFMRDGKEWRSLGSSPNAGRSAGTLPHILSLITPDQFRMITEDAATAILIQGIAGSGKTTVALHRLAWLLHEENSALKPDQCAVIVFSSALKRYVSGTLPSIDILGVDVLTFQEWAARSVRNTLPHLVDETGLFRRPSDKPGSGIERVKRSLAMLRRLEDISSRASASGTKLSAEQLICEALSDSRRLLEIDDTHLLDAELVKSALARSITNMEQGLVDTCDDALLVRAVQLAAGALDLKNGQRGTYGHIVADEVQDMSSAELACVIAAVPDSSRLTLVGDTAQKILTSSSFPGWEKLRENCSLKDSMSKYLSLSVSHRSTLPIMKLADHVQQRQLVTEGRPGRAPIWFRANDEQKGIRAVIDWLNKALERFPGALTAVICADPLEAKHALRMLQPSFGSGIRAGDESSFTFDEGIVVTDAAQVKGLEFMNVLLWNPSSKTYRSDEQSRNLLYIAISRAEENLCIVTWDRPTSILPLFGSKLLRNFDLIEEQPEEEEQSDQHAD
ncbi:MAG: AAA family ATPase [Deltaproteobacteria bacterium]|nr:AAA family ATPase [Deltaproteobacteria bacterium]